ncbi:GNAT family N-acetyltransferase [Ulvibacter antarcticus]|uniref:Phosphinothricin acetyltransferase n=1 Tax=Ulvibacter antarcticus TaxID=442714 RepID=A0A3L9ZHL5_9FLAO|nr:GNAT family N-acetyltransferase [Ulvibacter antarcticus]RMA66202.1 phosphinothricin acetyltransferase [Ulvibacter antarcticus]
MKIIALQKEHYPAVSEIYRLGISSGIATFETEIPDWDTWNKKFLAISRFVILENDQVKAWCALSAVSNRAVYKGVAEDTIYVAPECQGKGFGKMLLMHLIIESEKNGFWTLQAGIFSENKASIKLHENCGFRTIGEREKIAKRDNIWHDNIIMERRSQAFN